ncbi:apolipoprotein N-acyltransferase [Deinococcus sp. UYEF24]
MSPGEAETVRFRAWRDRLAMGTAAPSWLLPLLLGMVTGASLLSTFGAALIVLPLSFFFIGVQARTPDRVICWAAPFAVGFFGVHLQWLFSSLNTILGVPGGLLVLPVVAVLSAGLTTTLWLTRLLSGRWLLLALPAAWILFDWLRTLGSLAFPWGSIGYAASRTPAVQLASIGGVPLLAALVLGSAALLAHRRRWSICLAGAFWAVALLAGNAMTWPPALTTRTALLVQGSVDPRAKMNGTVDATEIYRELTRSGRPVLLPDVVLWPEAAVSFTPDRPESWSQLSRPGVPLITGAPGRQAGNAYNSAFALSGAGIYRYDKVRTVPFGESFPARKALDWLYRPVFAALGMPGLQNMTSGVRSAVLLAGTLRYAVSICYESVFPGLARRAVREGGQVLVTLSNDAWFGRSAGVEQHFLMGRVRAIETRRYWLRTGNDGITAVTDPYGRVQARLERGARTTLLAGFKPLTGMTPYVRFGDWVVVLALGTVLFCIFQNVFVSDQQGVLMKRTEV